MKKLLCLLLMLASFATASTVTGAVSSNSTALANGSVTFQLTGCIDTPKRISNGTTVSTAVQTFALDGSGVVSATIIGVDDIACVGVPVYKVRAFKLGNTLAWERFYSISGTAWDISIAVPISSITDSLVGKVVPANIAVKTGNNAFVGTNTFSGPVSFAGRTAVTSGTIGSGALAFHPVTQGSSFFSQVTASGDSALSGIADSTAIGANVYGVFGGTYMRHTSGTVSLASGVRGELDLTAAGGATVAAGVSGKAATESGSGSVSVLAGVSGTATSSSTTTSMASLYARSNSQTGGTVAKNFGLLIDDQNLLGVNNYAIATGLGKVDFGDVLRAGNRTTVLSSASTLMGSAAHQLFYLTDGSYTVGGSAVMVGTPSSGAAGFVGAAFGNGTTSGGSFVGLRGEAYQGASGAASSLIGVNARAQASSGSTTNATALHIDSVTGTVTNGYGIRVDDQTAATNSYAIKTGLGRVQFGNHDYSAMGNSQALLFLGSDVSIGTGNYSIIDATPTITVAGNNSYIPVFDNESVITGVGSPDVVFGENVSPVWTGSGTVSTLTGVASVPTVDGATHGSSTRVTDLVGIYTEPSLYNSAVATAVTGVLVDNIVGSSIGTVYGLNVLDQTAGSVNYAIKTGAGLVQLGDVLQLKPTTSKPACSSTTRGSFWYTAGANGVKDFVEVCAKDASDVYLWRALY